MPTMTRNALVASLGMLAALVALQATGLAMPVLLWLIVGVTVLVAGGLAVLEVARPISGARS